MKLLKEGPQPGLAPCQISELPGLLYSGLAQPSRWRALDGESAKPGLRECTCTTRTLTTESSEVREESDDLSMRGLRKAAAKEPLGLFPVDRQPLLLAGNGVPEMSPPRIQNETDYDGRTVNAIVRRVFRSLEVDGSRTMVKVKHTRNRWGGRAYINARTSRGYIYDANICDYREVGPVIPPGIDHLIVVRIGRPERYPCQYTPYRRKDSPGAWQLGDWKEALVTITAHETMHLRQFFKNPKSKRGRFNEVETEWAAFRLWRDWKKT